MSEQKYYTVGVTTPAAWDHVHNVLTQDGSLDDNIPARPIQCTDLKEHSPTRAVYLMTDEEAAQLSGHPDIKFIDLDKSQYPDLYPPNPDELHCNPNRYSSAVKNYRNLSDVPRSNPTSAELNRAGYQLYRCAQYDDPWQDQFANTPLNSTIPNTNTGKNIDVIVGDDGCWFGHVEFDNSTGNGPADYVGGNPLPGDGTCDLLDVVLEGPYYIDPAWFDASPGTRLTTRWDGTTVPVESVARAWWTTSSQRSAQFASAGTVAVPSYYTRANCNGTATVNSNEGDHGTPCCGQAYGRTYGWAYNANKWFIDAYGSYGFGFNVDLYFDVMKIFHVNKPVNTLYGTRDPTISSNSFGWRTTQGNTGYYYFRQGTSGSGGVQYSSKPAFMAYLGSSGDGNRFKGEMVTNSLTEAGDELIASGVIFVVAAGNSNQQQVGSANPNFNNYWASAASTPLTSATHSEFGSTCYNTTGRRGFPQQIGKYSDGGNIVYPAINIGALDDDFAGGYGGLERKVNYSDMGDQIDCYAPGDATLSSARTPYTSYPRYDQRAGGLTSSDTSFSGTSSACPTATGLIATALETNRSWSWQDIRTWLQSLTVQSDSTFYQGPDPTTATSSDWTDLNSLMGGTRRIIYNNITRPISSFTIGGSGLIIGGSGVSLRIG
jgi:hypothetical protein